MLITCAVPPGTKKTEFTPFPGDDAALAQGCVCPVEQDRWPAAVQFATDCPVHELQKPAN